MLRQSAAIKTFPLTAPLQAFFFCLLVSRGVFEIALPKKYAMALHFFLVLLFAFLLFGNIRLRFTKEDKPVLILGISFIAVTFISGFLTLFLHDRTFWIAYNSFNLALIGLGILLIRRFPKETCFPAPSFLLFVVGWFLFIPAILEHLHFTRFIGISYIMGKTLARPASLTGSFLHYPILMPLIGFALLNTKKLRLSALCFLAAPFLAFSRSGMFIAIATLFIYPFLSRSKNGIIAGLTLLLLIGTVPLITQSFPEESYIGKVHSRVALAASGSAIGNAGRIAKWKLIFQDWLDTNLLFGEDTGHYSNSTHQFEKQYVTYSKVLSSPESSILQLLSNYGLLGCLLFYLFLFQILRFIHPNHLWLKAVFIAACLQTLFYQSIEVVPYIILLFLFPWISQSTHYQQQTPS